ncbi:hypothetical protein [Actinoplanes sp. DH11]|uniref:hypothetical protein n=1 Tax=Actinoplanes sp. DH11 TaxID=2857011 RepID=UPI001E5E5DE2|nr:hypothetical protein [Actinoplanes sp. DH11]
MTYRTLILAPWLVALLAQADAHPRIGLLALAILLVWAAPLVRDRAVNGRRASM